MRTRSRIAVLGAIVGVLALVAGFTPANAEEQDLEMVITGGDLSVADLSIPLTAGSGGLTGVWDDVTGDFTGAFTVTTVLPFEVSPGTFVDIGVVINTLGDITGIIDPVTGDATLAGTLEVVIDAGAVVPGLTCDLSPVDMTWTSDPPGFPYDGTVLGLEDEGFSVPGAACSDPSVDAVINGLLGLPSTATSTLVELEVGEIPPPTTTSTTAAPVAPESTVAATPLQAQPSFTG